MAKVQKEDVIDGGQARAYSAPALEKSIDILEVLADASTGLTISEIAQRLSRSISEVFRVIIVMERRGWLHRDGSDRFSVTYRVLDMAFRATPAQDLTRVAAPIMHDLSNRTNQSCHLVVRGESAGMVVHRQENTGPVGFGIRLGAAIDLITSCSGHVLLAFAAADRRQALLDSLARPPSLTLEQVKRRLEVVRMQGYEMQPSARTAGVTDISFPVFGFDGGVVAAITIPYLVLIDGSQITDIAETRSILGEAASRISSHLGWFDEQDAIATG